MTQDNSPILMTEARRDGNDFIVPVDYERVGMFTSLGYDVCSYDTIPEYEFPVRGHGQKIIRMRCKVLIEESEIDDVRRNLNNERFPDRAEAIAFFRCFPDERKKDLVAFSPRAQNGRVICAHTSYGEIQGRIYTSAKWDKGCRVLVVDIK